MRIVNQVIACTLFLTVLSGCAYTDQPKETVQGSEVGATGDIRFNHESLGVNKHMITVTAAPGLLETEGSIAQRIHVFANRFAAKTCLTTFEFMHEPNFDQRIAGGFMKRTKSYVFVCKT
jgi:hypothetical protein